jgi:CDP-Glycerol:Poly(glycerophosphate) glycerophosphotransferase
MPEKAPILFLFNHDAGHQVAHSAGIAAATALQAKGRRVIAATGSAAIRAEVEKLIDAQAIAALDWIDLSLPAWLSLVLSPLNHLVPINRLIRLYWHRRRLRKAAMIVSTERTCLTLKRHWRSGKGPSFAYIPHGSGDRNVAVHPALKDFDLCLVSGQKLVDQFTAAGVSSPEKCRIIGYPKFDILRGRSGEKFFANDHPVFLYNPHFDPYLSSWFDEGSAILEYFYQHPEYNLIFAPHVMLFFKMVHISPEYKVSRRRPEILEKYRHAQNIKIDTDSPRLFDMSYTLAADAYIGDVSSQVYEFLYRPRPCYFIDVHSKVESGDEPEYDFWRNGPVVRSAKELAAVIPDFVSIGEDYRAIQIDRMAYTADSSDPRSASERGAEAILEFLG